MYVYILRSLQDEQKYYIGLTKDLKQRLRQHNNGESDYTRTLRPWKMTAAFWFLEDAKAVWFEKYLKTQSGRAFRSKHF
ncbi:MAG: GIY-YIG nuclease family protein [Elusimicrobiota bacterium]